jgi:cellobiose phosphorylase
MYRLIVESLLGLRKEADRLHLEPHLPEHWEGCQVLYRHQDTLHRIDVVQAERTDEDDDRRIRVTLDGEEQDGATIPLREDQQEHRVEVRVVLG